MSPVEHRLLHALKVGMRRGLAPRAVYLGPSDYRAFGRRTQVADLPVRKAKAVSRVYFKNGIAVQLPRRVPK